MISFFIPLFRSFYYSFRRIFVIIREFFYGVFFINKYYNSNHYFNFLNKKYSKIAETVSKMYVASSKKKVIWFFWWDGFNEMPLLCKKCLESITTFKDKDYSLIFIDKNNFFEYVELPSYIINKHKRGIISHTHFSDILRCALLVKHGGIWIDSTVYVTSPFPNYVYYDNFFVFKGSNFMNINCNVDGSNISSWFISSNETHPLLVSTLEMLYEYWKRHNRLNQYFLFHWFFTISSRKMIYLWENIKYYPNVLPHYLYFYAVNKKYSDSLFKSVNEMCFCHKLSRHLVFDKDSFLGKCFYEK